MIPVIGLLIILLMALCITRIATEALVLTGLSRTVARFQARSAYTGAGFTTSESECITRNAMRRQIVRWLMLIGHIGFVTVLGSVMLSFSDKFGVGHWVHWVVLGGGIAGLLWLTFSKWVERKMARIISWLLTKYAKIEVTDYSHLMHIGEDYGISAMPIPQGSWLADSSLEKLPQTRHGFVLLGIETPGGDYNGAPHGDIIFHVGDVLILYGPMPKIQAFRDTLSAPNVPDNTTAPAAK